MSNEDKIMKRLQELEAKSNSEGISKIIYGEICNDLINPWVPMRPYLKKFEIPKINKFKSKEDPKEHLRYFKYACYQIVNNDSLLLRTFPMTLRFQEMN